MLPILEKIYEEGEYCPTIKDVRKWFGILNEVIFDGKLPKPSQITIQQRKGQFGSVEARIDVDRIDLRVCHLEMNETFRDFKFFITILAHEMVHCHQWMVLGKKPGHGKNFFVWRDKLEAQDIPLAIKY